MNTSLALTKFRTPRLRPDTVPREDLLRRLERSVDSNPLTLVCAPGGSGKTVLLSQLAASIGTARKLLWIALDADDDDPNRLFAALVRAVESLGLTWEVDPRALVAGVAAGRGQARAGLAALVNALCTTAAERVIIVIDDLHRLVHPEVFSLLEALIERLPDHVSLVIGTRVEPPLPLARWRAHGELGEFSPADLRFDEDAVRALARTEGARDAEPDLIRHALTRTDGWAVGVSLLLQSHASATPEANRLHGARAQSRLFAYLAQEVLADLEPDLREFALRCSILDEMTPPLCRAVAERGDAAERLRELYRRNLFVTVVDEATPVLRFHDLFRDFLQQELRRAETIDIDALHTRAARSESVPSRAIAHYIAARRWADALDVIARIGDDLLREGAIATLERWFDQLPPEVRESSPEVAYLNGGCGWLRWDWLRATRDLPPAIAGFTRPEDQPRRVRALFQLVDALASSGDIDGARQRLDEVARMPLDDLGHAALAVQRAWCLTHDGTHDDIVASMNEFVDYASRDPARICPLTAGLVHCILVGKPGVAECFERFVALADAVREPQGRPWHLPLLAIDGWARVWRGDRAGAERALARAEAIFKQFRGIRLMGERINQYRTLLLGLTQDVAVVDRLARETIGGMETPELASHRAVWGRAYRHGYARILWSHGAIDDWLRVTQSLLTPRSPVEWPFIDLAGQIVRGQRAIVAKDWRSAIALLEGAQREYPRLCLPTIFGDPRVSLGFAWLGAGDATAAWRAFEPVYREVVRDRAVGALLLDARANVGALLAAAPSPVRATVEFKELVRVLATWNATGLGEAPVRAGVPGDGLLSEREREVLALVASGASNKHIARELDLSLHTVKRHVCNILDKIDCDSRGQAADWFRRAQGAALAG